MTDDTKIIACLARHGMAHAYIRKIVAEELVRTRTQDLEVPQTLLTDYMNKNEIFDDASLNLFLAANLMSKADLERLLENNYRQEAYVQEVCMKRVGTRFLQRKDDLDQIVYSLIRVQSSDLALELYLRIGEGEAGFGELASEVSQGPERATCGVVGPVPLTQAHPLLVDRLRSADIGKLIEPFEVEQWWLLVRLESRHPAICDDQTKMELALEIFEEEITTATSFRLEQISAEYIGESV